MKNNLDRKIQETEYIESKIDEIWEVLENDKLDKKRKAELIESLEIEYLVNSKNN